MRDAIVTLPEPCLREVAASIECFDVSLVSSVEKLTQAMRSGPGGVGIAATQVGWMQRVIVVDCSLAQHACAHHGLQVLVNPAIIAHGDAVKLGREGCLSVPDWVGTVPRFQHITVCFQDVLGQVQQIDAKGYEARVLQHEIDHLDGVLFVDRVVSTRDLVRRLETKVEVRA